MSLSSSGRRQGAQSSTRVRDRPQRPSSATPSHCPRPLVRAPPPPATSSATPPPRPRPRHMALSTPCTPGIIIVAWSAVPVLARHRTTGAVFHILQQRFSRRVAQRASHSALLAACATQGAALWLLRRAWHLTAPPARVALSAAHLHGRDSNGRDGRNGRDGPRSMAAIGTAARRTRPVVPTCSPRLLVVVRWRWRFRLGALSLEALGCERGDEASFWRGVRAFVRRWSAR